jgi:CCR4-NOT transcriptional regulation complex NOT5 subunit
MAKESTGQAASKKQLIIVAVALATLLGVVYFMFLRGGEEPASSATPAPSGETNPAEEEPSDENKNDETEAPKKNSKGPVETSEVFGGKDPFEPVIDLTPVVAAAGDADATTDATTPTTDDGTTTTPTTPTTPVPPVTPPPDNDDNDDDDERIGWSVKLLKVYTAEGGVKTALVETVKRETDSDKSHTLVDGERFRKHFKLVSLQGRCASFLFNHEWFALCDGQRTVRTE